MKVKIGTQGGIRTRRTPILNRGCLPVASPAHGTADGIRTHRTPVLSRGCLPVASPPYVGADFGPGDRGRTCTTLRSRVPQTRASANSATPGRLKFVRNIFHAEGSSLARPVSRGGERAAYFPPETAGIARSSRSRYFWWSLKESHLRHPACKTGVLLLN
jgi:hypothetical protein